ncbi:MAG: cation:proton antiporter [Candidatus Omnitrophica bacterium]|nr:cation:proton antiporter [Candidatus Omnitrophota bacterium]MBU4589300.1 cation:proton antiporter [Candidatus Omnitrophota bacterium]
MILFLGVIIILGYIGGKLSNRFKFPAVIGYLLAGLLLGPSVLNILKIEYMHQMGIISDIALGVVAFTIGSEIRLGILKKLGKGILTVVFTESFFAFFAVLFLVYFFTHKIYIALLLAAMAPASAPAGTVVVLQENKAKGPLTNALLTVVGLDDGLAIMIYAFATCMAKIAISQEHMHIKEMIGRPVIEILGAIILGSLLGLILNFFIRRMRAKTEILIAALGFVFVCSGLANFFNFSLILANLALGMLIANTFLKGSRRTYEALHFVTPPLYILFFVLAGAHLQLNYLPKIGVIGLLYIVGRSFGLISGAWFGATIMKMHKNIRKYLGLGILSQAGVAIGLSIMVGKEFSNLNDIGNQVATLVINTVAGTTIFFELIGPLTTKFAIKRAGEIGKQRSFE